MFASNPTRRESGNLPEFRSRDKNSSRQSTNPRLQLLSLEQSSQEHSKRKPRPKGKFQKTNKNHTLNFTTESINFFIHIYRASTETDAWVGYQKVQTDSPQWQLVTLRLSTKAATMKAEKYNPGRNSIKQFKKWNNLPNSIRQIMECISNLTGISEATKSSLPMTWKRLLHPNQLVLAEPKTWKPAWKSLTRGLDMANDWKTETRTK